MPEIGWLFLYVLAAWPFEEKSWCGTEFGLGSYDPSVCQFAEATPCFPSMGLEIPTAGWPGPNEGTAFVTTDVPWNGNWVPVYFMGGYVYGYYGATTLVPIEIDPLTGNCGFANCTSPPAEYAVPPEGRGALGINTPGIVPLFGEPPERVCCFPSTAGQQHLCEILREDDCATAGGIWFPQWSSCDPNPCESFTPIEPSSWGRIRNLYR